MLPLGILKASTKKVRIRKKSRTETMKIFAHSQRNASGPAPRFTSRSASRRCSAVIRDPTGVTDGTDSCVLMRLRDQLGR